MTPEQAAKYFKSEEKSFWQERKRQVAEYTGEVAPKQTASENYAASIKESGGFGYSKGEEFEALQGKFPGLTQRKYNIAVTRSKGSGRSLEETVKDMMTPVGENEPGLMRITGEQRIQVKKQQAKAAAKQKRQIAKDVKNLRATKGPWKGI